MARYIKQSVSSLAGINSELTKIQTAIQDTLSRKSDVPNQVEGNLDMNSNRILNLPDPVQDREPVPYGMFKAGTGGADGFAVRAEQAAIESEASAVRSSDSASASYDAALSAEFWAKSVKGTGVEKVLVSDLGVDGRYDFIKYAYTPSLDPSEPPFYMFVQGVLSFEYAQSPDPIGTYVLVDTAGMSPTDEIVFIVNTALETGGGGGGGGDPTLRPELALTTSTVLVGGKEAGKLAKATTRVTPAEWGIKCDGSDETVKWKALITYCGLNRLGIGAFSGETLVTEKLTLPTGFGGIWGDSQLYMVFKKGFNGDVFSVNNQATMLSNFWIKGEGATFSGGGIYVVSDNVSIDHVRIEGTLDSPIICKANASQLLDVTHCHLAALDTNTVASIRSDGVDSVPNPSVRKFDRISGTALVLDASGMNEVALTNSLFTNLITGGTTSKLKMSNCRITSATANINVYGNDHVFSNNIITTGVGYSLRFLGNNIRYDDSNNYISGSDTRASPETFITYGSPYTNVLSTEPNFVSESVNVFEGTSTSFVKGNGSVSVNYSLRGSRCAVNFGLTIGSTSVAPTGLYKINLPTAVRIASSGSAVVQIGGVNYAAVVQANGGNNYALMYINGESTAVGSDTRALTVGSSIQGSIEYVISVA